MRNLTISNSELTEENERLLGSIATERAERTGHGPPATASPATGEHQKPQHELDENRSCRTVLVIPAASQPASTSGRAGGLSPGALTHARTPSLDSLKSVRSSSSGSSSSDALAAAKGEVGLCRICLEEDSLSNLEQPCACAGTQKYTHHECIQVRPCVR